MTRSQILLNFRFHCRQIQLIDSYHVSTNLKASRSSLVAGFWRQEIFDSEIKTWRIG